MISLRDVVTGFGNRDPLAEVWRRSLRGGGGGSAVITGVPPLRYIGNGNPLTDYRIAGNAIQDGTPSPDAPVDATGCGVRTANLFTGEYSQFDNVGGSGDLYAYFYAPNTTMTLIAKDDYKVSPGLYFGFTANGGDAEAGYRWMILPNEQYVKGDVVTRTIPTGWSFVSMFQKTEATFKKLIDHFYIMLNLGSTALPYEPYGFKLPLTVNGVEYPIYLGKVETTRRVKKLVLTGEETWSIYGGGKQFQLIFSSEAARNNLFVPVSNCYKGTQVSGWNDLNDEEFSISPSSRTALRVCDPRYENDLSAFKSYLATQYANGTPVTVWYVLAEPETAIVNEPLMKIGDYADTISFAQAGVSIPTINGENVLDVPTTVPPSEITIKGGISSV